MSTVSGRALHWVFKIADRPKAINFFRDVLGMKVLRHEEFEKGCEATCNGPYAGQWSKTMIGYGSENTEFVFELTYNYGIIDGYKLGNDFLSAHLELTKANMEQVRASGYKLDSNEGDVVKLTAPDGYLFVLNEGATCTRVEKIAVGASILEKSTVYWSGLLGLKLKSKSEKSALVTFGDVSGFSLELVQSDSPIDRKTAPGRLAFSYPEEGQEALEAKVRDSKQGTIINSLIKLDTPGKATVQVVIFGDVDGHEICFVGDTGYRALSVFDPKGDELLNCAMVADKSLEYAEKMKKSGQE